MGTYLRSINLYQAPGAEAQPSWRYLPHCLVAALLLRLGLHMFSDFVAYTDELQQYLEQGHRLAFGYGIMTWEWHWGARSYLLPGIIAGLLLPFKWLGIDNPAYYVPFVEAFFCIFSLLIPWGLYHFTRHQHGEAAGRIALLLGVVSFYLLAFAAKTLTETMAGTLLAAAMGLAGRPFIRGGGGLVFGALLACAAYLRYAYLPVLGILWLAIAVAMPMRWALRSALAGIATLLALGILDYLTWGRLFSSIHIHLLFNLQPPPDYHVSGGEIFYPQRLLFLSAGAVLLAVFAWLRHPRLHLLTLLLTLAVLLPHMFADHKEFRFIAPLLFLWMPAAAWQLSDWSHRARLRPYRHDLVRALLALQLAFSALVATGIVNDFWVYKIRDFDRGGDQLGYLHNTPDFFAGIAWLHEQEDLQGVYFGESNFNYYHLHRDVPIYDVFKITEASRKHPDKKLVSHILTYYPNNDPAFRLVKKIGRAHIYEDVRMGKVYANDYTSMSVDARLWHYAATILPAPVER